MFTTHSGRFSTSFANVCDVARLRAVACKGWAPNRPRLFAVCMLIATAACGGTVETSPPCSSWEDAAALVEASPDVVPDVAEEPDAPALPVCLGPPSVCPPSGCPCDSTSPAWGWKDDAGTTESCATCPTGTACYFLSSGSPLGVCQ